MNHSHQTFRQLTLVLALLTASGAQAERTFKWVDEEGNIHYGDRVPMQYSTQERKEINQQGRTLKVYETPKTSEEIAEQKRLAAIAAEEKKRQEAQAEIDRILLATYSSAADIEMMRDSRVASIEELIQLTDSRISSLQNRLEGLNQESRDYEARGKPVPKYVEHQTESIRNQISQNQTFIEAKQKEMEDIQKTFAADIARYREIQDDHQSDKY